MLRMIEIPLVVIQTDGTTSSFCFSNCQYYDGGIENRNRNNYLLAFGYAHRAETTMKEILYVAH